MYHIIVVPPEGSIISLIINKYDQAIYLIIYYTKLGCSVTSTDIN